MEVREDRAGRSVVTVSGLRMMATRHGQLKIGHRLLDCEDGDRVVEAVQRLTQIARANRDAMRRPRRERGL